MRTLFIKHFVFLAAIINLFLNDIKSMDAPQQSEERPIGPINSIAPENHFRICSFLSAPSDFGSLGQVSQNWNDIIQDIFKNTQDSIIVIGESGAGKSSLVHLLAEKQIYAQRALTGLWQLSCEEQLGNINIEHAWKTGTKRPTCIIDLHHKRKIWDCPPFNSTLGKEADFANALKIRKVLTTGKIKVVVAVTEGQFQLCYGEQILMMLNCINEIFAHHFQDYSKATGIISFAITKRTKRCTSQALWKNLLAYVDQNEEEKKFLSPRAYCLLMSLTRNASLVVDFPAPLKNGLYEINDSLLPLINCDTYFLCPQVEEPVEKSLKGGDGMASLMKRLVHM